MSALTDVPSPGPEAVAALARLSTVPEVQTALWCVWYLGTGLLDPGISLMITEAYVADSAAAPKEAAIVCWHGYGYPTRLQCPDCGDTPVTREQLVAEYGKDQSRLLGPDPRGDAVSTSYERMGRPLDSSDCTCLFSCADDPKEACGLSGEWHVHPQDDRGVTGPCPVHPEAPGDR